VTFITELFAALDCPSATPPGVNAVIPVVGSKAMADGEQNWNDFLKRPHAGFNKSLHTVR
jgi:hypothetical protein